MWFRQKLRSAALEGGRASAIFLIFSPILFYFFGEIMMVTEEIVSIVLSSFVCHAYDFGGASQQHRFETIFESRGVKDSRENSCLCSLSNCLPRENSFSSNHCEEWMLESSHQLTILEYQCKSALPD